jgi:hypothetical protein
MIYEQLIKPLFDKAASLRAVDLVPLDQQIFVKGSALPRLLNHPTTERRKRVPPFIDRAATVCGPPLLKLIASATPPHRTPTTVVWAPHLFTIDSWSYLIVGIVYFVAHDLFIGLSNTPVKERVRKEISGQPFRPIRTGRNFKIRLDAKESIPGHEEPFVRVQSI